MPVIPILTLAQQRAAAEMAACLLDREQTPLPVTIGGVEMITAGTMGPEEIAALMDGGSVHSFAIGFRLPKADFAEPGAPEIPGIGSLVQVAGSEFMISRVFGHLESWPVLSFQATRNINR